MKTSNEKQFDCIKLKDQIQADVYAETKHMTKEELLRYFNDIIKHSAPIKQNVLQV